MNHITFDTSLIGPRPCDVTGMGNFKYVVGKIVSLLGMPGRCSFKVMSFPDARPKDGLPDSKIIILVLSDINV